MTREAVAAEAIAGGFSAVYPVLRAMEEAGRIRRGYFVDGLGAAQFALAGALDRLRAVRDPPGERPGDAHGSTLLAAADPANPYGAALAWPRRGDDDRRPLPRAAGAYVVLVDGEAALYLDRGGGSSRRSRRPTTPDRRAAALRALGALVADGRARELVIAKVDGEPGRRVAVSGSGCSRPASCPATAGCCASGSSGRRPAAGSRSQASMPEGDTLYRTAAGLAPAPRRADGERGPGRPGGPQVGRARRGRRRLRSRRSARTCSSGSPTGSSSGPTCG